MRHNQKNTKLNIKIYNLFLEFHPNHIDFSQNYALLINTKIHMVVLCILRECINKK
jgi:hypothetical protein